MTKSQASVLIDLIWPYMRKDREHRDRVQTAWGTKTKQGLIACIDRIMNDAILRDPNHPVNNYGTESIVK